MQQSTWLRTAALLYILSAVVHNQYWAGFIYTLAVFSFGVTVSKYLVSADE